MQSKKGSKNRIVKIIVLLLPLLVILYSSRDEFLNKISNFGIAEFYSQKFNEAFLYIRLYDMDDDNDKEIVRLSEKNKSLSINIYDWKNNKIEKIDSFVLEDKETRMIDWEIEDLDNDGMFEVIVSLEQGKESEIRIYKKINDKFNMIEALDYKRDIEVIENRDGKKELICYYSGKIISYSFTDGEFVKNYDDQISTTGLGLTKADFNGDGFDELYFIKDEGNGTKESKCIFIEIERRDEGIIESEAGEIDIHSKTLYYREPHNFLVYDMDEDGKDDIIFQTRSRLGIEPWMDTFTLKDNKWIKIYSGGHLKDLGRDDIWDISFLSKGDINGDGVEELIMTGDAKSKYYDEREGEPVDCKVFFYEIEPHKFKLNGFFQRLLR